MLRTRLNNSVGQNWPVGYPFATSTLLSPAKSWICPRCASSCWRMKLNRARQGSPASRRGRLEPPSHGPSLPPHPPLHTSIQAAPLSGPFSSLQVAVCTALAANFCRCKIIYARVLPSQTFSPGRLSSQTTEVV